MTARFGAGCAAAFEDHSCFSIAADNPVAPEELNGKKGDFPYIGNTGRIDPEG